MARYLRGLASVIGQVELVGELVGCIAGNIGIFGLVCINGTADSIGVIRKLEASVVSAILGEDGHHVLFCLGIIEIHNRISHALINDMSGVLTGQAVLVMCGPAKVPTLS